MEGLNISQENNEDSFNEFKRQINERASIYKNVVGSFVSEVALPDKFTEYQNQIDSEAFLCLTRTKDIKDLSEKNNKKVLGNLKSNIDELFDVPVKTLDARLESMKIVLDTKPMDVWQEKHNEFIEKIDAINKHADLNPELVSQINDLKSIFEKSLEDLYDAKNEQLNRLQDFYDANQLEESRRRMNDGSSSIDNNIKHSEETNSNYNAEIFKLVDTFEFNCKEILAKAFEDFESQRNNSN